MKNPWDQYAPFYDWENARTMGRRDVPFWKTFAAGRRGRTLELGCGTGRLLIPLARTGARLVGVDFSADMLERARTRSRALPSARRPGLVRGDIRALPIASASLERVMAPYGVLQSLISDNDLSAAIHEVHRILKPGGRFGIDLVPDLVDWRAYQKQVRFRGTLRGQPITLVESVRQQRKAGITIFDEDYRLGRGRTATRRRFSLTFKTVPMDAMIAGLEEAGFQIDLVSGSYTGSAWTRDAPVWLIVARRPRVSRSQCP